MAIQHITEKPPPLVGRKIFGLRTDSVNKKNAIQKRKTVGDLPETPNVSSHVQKLLDKIRAKKALQKAGTVDTAQASAVGNDIDEKGVTTKVRADDQRQHEDSTTQRAWMTN